MPHAENHGSRGAQSKPRINWSHPVTLLILTSIVSAGGWGINYLLTQRDRSDLRFQVEDVTQGINLISGRQPSYNGQPVFCDTAKLTLVLAHNGGGKLPILVHNIGIKAERLADDSFEHIDCAVDTLSAKPFGIILRNTYILDVSNTGRSGRYIGSAKPSDAFKVDPDNVLKIADQKQAISLKPDEEPLGYDVFVEAQSQGLYRIWFTTNYDASGPKTQKTESFLLGK